MTRTVNGTGHVVVRVARLDVLLGELDGARDVVFVVFE